MKPDTKLTETTEATNPEYLLVTDKTSEIIKVGEYNELKRLATLIRRAGGEVTIFKSTQG